MEHNTPGGLHCITISLQESTPQVKPVSIAFRYDMTEALADFKKELQMAFMKQKIHC